MGPRSGHLSIVWAARIAIDRVAVTFELFDHNTKRWKGYRYAVSWMSLALPNYRQVTAMRCINIRRNWYSHRLFSYETNFTRPRITAILPGFR